MKSLNAVPTLFAHTVIHKVVNFGELWDLRGSVVNFAFQVLLYTNRKVTKFPINAHL